jgi:hypothetical protein
MKTISLWLAGILFAGCLPLREAAASPPAGLFARTNLVAWCIVPFDAKKRGPEARAAMLQQLDLTRFAYDWRAEHLAHFEAEIAALKQHGIKLEAWWFPATLNEDARRILDVLQRHNLRPQLWVSGGGTATRSPAEQRARVESEAQRIRAIAEAAAAIGCTVALYNHGGWYGDPENQVQIIHRLRTDGVTNVGLVYNLHHGHEHLDRFAALLSRMKPHLLALNLNGMMRGGDQLGQKILPLGQGELDLALLEMIRDSGWQGPVGILGHTQDDAEHRLLDNLDGLDWLVRQLEGKPAGPKPNPRTMRH